MGKRGVAALGAGLLLLSTAFFSYFVGTEMATRHAEAFAFRRMTVAQLADQASVDVTPVNRTRNFHNFSLETPEFFDDLYLRLGNRATPRSRRIYAVEGPDGQIYWVLTRGR